MKRSTDAFGRLCVACGLLLFLALVIFTVAEKV